MPVKKKDPPAPAPVVEAPPAGNAAKGRRPTMEVVAEAMEAGKRPATRAAEARIAARKAREERARPVTASSQEPPRPSLAASPGPDVDPDQTSLVPIPMTDLVLDPELQGRAHGLDETTVDEYADAMRRGAVFPAVRVIQDRETGALLLVDGWHREAAARKAGKTALLGQIIPGTRRDAILAAAAANPSHGLKRSHDDKRRAVRMVLMDEEYAQLSGRALGALVNVSHTYVDEVRKHYGLTPGKVLTIEHRERTDGVPTEAWRALMHGKEKWMVNVLERVRKAATVDELAKAPNHAGEVGEMAIRLRLGELQTEPWPWPEDLSDDVARERHRRNVVESIDTVEDARTALVVEGCPEPKGLLHILANVHHLTSDYGYMEFDKLAAEWAFRPALMAALGEARARRREVESKDPTAGSNAIGRLKDDPPAQLAAFLAAPVAVQRACYPRQLAPEVRDGPFREALNTVDGFDRQLTDECQDPSCAGWVPPGENARCVVCNASAAQVEAAVRNGLRTACILLNHPGYGFEPTDGVIIDEGTVALLSMLTEEMKGGEPAWLAKVPASIRTTLKSWRDRARPVVLIGIREEDPHAAPVGGSPAPAPIDAQDVDDDPEEGDDDGGEL